MEFCNNYSMSLSNFPWSAVFWSCLSLFICLICLHPTLGYGGPRRIPSYLTVILAEPGSILLPQPNIFLLQLNAPSPGDDCSAPYVCVRMCQYGAARAMKGTIITPLGAVLLPPHNGPWLGPRVRSALEL
jgi:hypothetical protein